MTPPSLALSIVIVAKSLMKIHCIPGDIGDVHRHPIWESSPQVEPSVECMR